HRRRAGHWDGRLGGKTADLGQTLGHARFTGLHRHRLCVQRRGGYLFWFLSRPQSIAARSHRGAAVRVREELNELTLLSQLTELTQLTSNQLSNSPCCEPKPTCCRPTHRRDFRQPSSGRLSCCAPAKSWPCRLRRFTGWRPTLSRRKRF